MGISHITLRVVAYDWDNLDAIKNKIYELLKGIDEKEIKINEHKDKGLVSTFLHVFEVKLSKKKHIEIFLSNLFERIGNFDDFIRNINFDENFSVYLRIDKNSLIEKNIVNLVDSGNVFHVKISFDMYNKSREIVIKILEDFYKKVIKKD